MFDATILLVSTDSALISTVTGVVASLTNLRLEVLATPEEIGEYLQRHQTSLVLSHLPATKDSSRFRSLLKTISASAHGIPLLVISDTHQPEQALAFLREGVTDYLSRPLNLNHLAYLIDVLTVPARCATPPAASRAAAVASLGASDEFLYNPAAESGPVIEQVKRVAPQDTTILLGGETGTGKTSLARVIHELSPRREQPFLVVNCGSLSANLIESELFGHVKGAFTGADRDRTGKCAEVGRGTLLLDEIDALPPDLQAKLLRVVEERIFEPIGSNRSLRLEARLIVASNRHLDQEVSAGRFRADLFYRLNVVGFYLPPLRERRLLIEPLVQKYIREFAARNQRPVVGIAPAALQTLQEHEWPGNIRELRNVIERAVALSSGAQIGMDDLPAALLARYPACAGQAAPQLSPLPVQDGSLATTKAAAEAQRILAALQKHNNNRLRAAAELGISRMTLYKKLHRYGLMPA
jgi:DNA-binding NtrC family response regulator